jgi:hypothetical protein
MTTKSKFHVARINKMLHYTVNMTINTVGTLNLSTEFGVLFVFSAFIETLDFFFQEMCPPFSMLNAKCFEVVYVLHHLYIMYINLKTSTDIT